MATGSQDTIANEYQVDCWELERSQRSKKLFARVKFLHEKWCKNACFQEEAAAIIDDYNRAASMDSAFIPLDSTKELKDPKIVEMMMNLLRKDLEEHRRETDELLKDLAAIKAKEDAISRLNRELWSLQDGLQQKFPSTKQAEWLIATSNGMN